VVFLIRKERAGTLKLLFEAGGELDEFFEAGGFE
jgi:hypothetical protein